MNEFWTAKKIGRRHDLPDIAASLYNEYALCSPEQLLARLKQSKFTFGNYGPVAWNNFLEKANLDDCLKPQYVEKALKVTSTQPAIGKGEFLFVSVFDNVGFAKHSGDLVELTNNKKIEVKGVSSTLGNGNSDKFVPLRDDDNSDKFVPLRDGQLSTIFRQLGGAAPDKLDGSACQQLKKLMGSDINTIYKTIAALQNTAFDNKEIVDQAVQYYTQTGHLLKTIAAMHLFAYMLTEHIDYLLAVNEKCFRCFDAPKTFSAAVNIISKFEIEGWKVGKYGVTVTLGRN